MTTIKINGKSFQYYNQYAMDSTLDSVASTFSLNILYSEEDKETFKPLSYRNIKIFEDGKQVLNGTILNHSFQSDEYTNFVSISGYSTAGIIEDCTTPYSLYPLESINKSLKEICDKLLPYFGVSYIIDESVKREMNLIFTKSIASPEDTVKEYLSKLAAQRNIVISHTQNGELLFFRPNAKKKSKGLFNKENTFGASLEVNGQSMMHKLYVVRQPAMPKISKKGQKKIKPKTKYFDEISNDFVKDNKRTAVRLMSSGEDLDTKQAVENYLMDQLRNITLNIAFDESKDFEIGDIIEYVNNELYINKPQRFMVTGISKSTDIEGSLYQISCHIPEAFAGGQPKQIFDL